MQRPEVTLSNYEDVYRYYAEHSVNKPVATLLHLASAALYHPRVTYADGAEEQLGEHLDVGGRVILTSNHIQMFDQLPIAALMQTSVLQPMVGSTVVWAKRDYFTQGWLRPALDSVGGIPVWRDKDYASDEEKQASFDVIMALLDATVQSMQDGAHLFAFPEGTRNTMDIRQLGKVQSGVGHVAVKAARRLDRPVALTPTALWYGENTKVSLRPRLHVGTPIMVDRSMSGGRATKQLQEAMEASLLVARSK